MREITLGAQSRGPHSPGLLDTRPLSEFLVRAIEFPRIAKNISEGRYDALCVSATSYESGELATFVQTEKEFDETGSERRRFHKRAIDPSIVLASSAVPLFFPAHKLDLGYFGDGSVGNQWPLGPALRLGAEKIVVVGVRKLMVCNVRSALATSAPGIGQMLSSLFNATMLDHVESDIERVDSTNRILARMHPLRISGKRQVQTFSQFPSQSIAALAQKHAGSLPRILKFSLGAMGADEDVGELSSYLMFHGPFCEELVRLGETNIHSNRENLLNFLDSN
jgi:NTE family protein